MNTLYYHIKLLRPLNVFTSGLAMLIASAILGTLQELDTVILVMVVVMSYAGAANALNDVVDFEIDKINRPMTPSFRKCEKTNSSYFINYSFFHRHIIMPRIIRFS